MKARKKLLMAATGAAFTLLGTIGSAPAQAALFNFQFKFNAQETGEPVSGNFVFDDSTRPIVTPDGNKFYGSASPGFTINAGKDVFEGSSTSVAVADNFVNPANGSVVDQIVFDDFKNFVPGGDNKFLANFVYPPDSLSSSALSALPTDLPSSAFAIINTPTGATLSSANASTSIAPVNASTSNRAVSVPEPTSTWGVLTLGALGTGSLLLRKWQSN